MGSASLQRFVGGVGSPECGAVRRRWTTAALCGGVPGVVLQCWMLTAGSWDLLRWGRQSDFYDVQARSLLNGTFAMDQRVLGIESFARGDQHFMYFGPVPALLRLPFVAFTRQLDGRLAAISMLLALGVTLVALLSLGWRLRRRVVTADDRVISRFESVSVALTFFAMIGGSSLLYASSRTWVYHEAILWGVALTLASLAFLLAWLDHRSSWLLVVASAFAMLAILTRPSVGGGALAAMGLVAGRELLAMLPGDRRRDAGADDRDGESDGSDDPHARHWVHGTLTVAVVVVPVLVYSLVNWLKFRRLLGVPFDQQGYTLLSQQRRDMLDANGGTLFNPNFVPTNLVTYLRPDLVGLDGTFPFIQPRRPVGTIGSPFYDLIDLTSGVPTTMPLLLGLALVGCWAVARNGNNRLREVWPLLVGCGAGTVAVLAIGYLANRYQSDFLPLLAVGALTGLPVLTERLTSGSPRRGAQSSVVTLFGVLVVVGTLTNLALGYSFQRAYGPSTHPDVVAGYIAEQSRVDGWLRDGELAHVTQAPSLPDGSRIGDVAIIGQCDGLYLSDGGVASDDKPTQWRLAELSPSHGGARGTITLDRSQTGSFSLVGVTTTGSSSDAPTEALIEATIEVGIDVDIGRGIMTAVAINDGVVTRGPDLPLGGIDLLTWELFADPVLGRFEVFLDGRFAVFTDMPSGGAVTVTVGGDADRVDGQAPEVCDGLLADLESSISEPLRLVPQG